MKQKKLEDDKKKSNKNRNKPDIMDYTKYYAGTEEPVDTASYEEPEKVEFLEEDVVIEEDIFDKVEEIDIYEDPEDEIELISVEEYDNEKDDYAKLSFNLYRDGTLADEMDQIIEDVDYKIGLETLKGFLADDDEVDLYIRNNDLCVDYEILKDERTYFEMTGKEGQSILDI